jgi:dTMP kinase
VEQEYIKLSTEGTVQPFRLHNHTKPLSFIKPSLKPWPFFTFEGGEGSGKSTQIQRVAEALRARGHVLCVTREPGGSEKAETYRAALLSGHVKPHGRTAEALVFAAARLDHLQKVIRPALIEGQLVLCDRFHDSTHVYQGTLGGLSDDLLNGIDDTVLGLGTERLVPQRTFLLDVPAKIGLARAAARRAKAGEEPDRFEAESLETHTRIREAFLARANAEPERFIVLDATKAPEFLTKTILEALLPLLEAANAAPTMIQNLQTVPA